jgi:hypothetical protein
MLPENFRVIIANCGIIKKEGLSLAGQPQITNSGMQTLGITLALLDRAVARTLKTISKHRAS